MISVRGVAVAAVAAMVLLAAGAAQAAPITWGSATLISADADVLNTGTLVYAYHYTYGDVTVNGVTFRECLAMPASGADVTSTDFYSTTSASFGIGNSGTPWGNLSDKYQPMLTGGTFTYPGSTGTVALNNLTEGKQYEVQIWVDDSRSDGWGRYEDVSSAGGNTVRLDYNNTDAVGAEEVGGVGQYAIGTFTADGISQSFALAAGDDPGYTGAAQINAIQVRLVPEPATLSLLALGGILAFRRRRR